MGCARFIWNAKCDEHRYYSTYARKYFPMGTFAPVDQKAAQFKSKELTPWLYQCPSQIIRNSATNWYQTYQNFMKGICGKPQRKRKTDKASMYLTREVFSFDERGQLFIGTKTNNIGLLKLKRHRDCGVPNSITVRKEAGHYYVSFCFDNGNTTPIITVKEHLDYLQGASREWLENNVVGIDRGVVVPAHSGDTAYDFSDGAAIKQVKYLRYIKRYQRRLAKQVKGSAQRNKTKFTLARQHKKIANIRQDFCHQTSRALVNSPAKVIVFEALNTSAMTKKPKVKQAINGKYLANNAAAKAGLNRAILNVGWHYLENYTRYKADKVGKAVFKVSPAYTSQECVICDHTHPDNRKTQAIFKCVGCGHIDNADRNSSFVVKKRAINLILHSGTELVGKGIPLLITGRGAKRKTDKSKLLSAVGSETSKKTRLHATPVAV